MSIIIFLIMGGIIGWLASIVVGKNSRMGAVANVIVGILGSFIGSYLFAGNQGLNVFTVRGFLFSVLGAVILLLVFSLFTRKR